MCAGKNPTWLHEIRAYWKDVSARLRDETGNDPRSLSGESTPLPFSAGKEVPTHKREKGAPSPRP